MHGANSAAAIRRRREPGRGLGCRHRDDDARERTELVALGGAQAPARFVTHERADAQVEAHVETAPELAQHRVHPGHTDEAWAGAWIRSDAAAVERDEARPPLRRHARVAPALHLLEETGPARGEVLRAVVEGVRSIAPRAHAPADAAALVEDDDAPAVPGERAGEREPRHAGADDRRLGARIVQIGLVVTRAAAGRHRHRAR
jgi:hypothetical protein